MGKSIQVEIELSILEWLIEIVPPSEDERYQKLLKWRNNELKPTWSSVKAASKKFHIPLGYFFLKQPPIEKFEVLEYRTLAGTEIKTISRELTDTLSRMEQIQQWMREMRIDEGMLPLTFVGEGKEAFDRNDIMDSADQLCKHLGLASNWKVPNSAGQFSLLRERLGDLGILIFQDSTANGNTSRPLNLQEFRAFTLIDDYAPLIFINNIDKGYGKVFSLLHEAVHIWVGRSSFLNDDSLCVKNAIEPFCNAVTAEILVPAEIFRQQWALLPDKMSIKDKIKFLAKELRCSESVVSRRALDHQYITKQLYETLNKELHDTFTSQNKKDKSGGSYWNTIKSNLDKQFIEVLGYGTKSGKISYTEAYRLSTLNRINFDKLIGIN